MSDTCYCDLWQKDPEFLARQGIPRGYCGICQACGASGHCRHYPGPVPLTGAWCDGCYARLPAIPLLSKLLCALSVTSVIGVLLLIYWLL